MKRLYEINGFFNAKGTCIIKKNTHTKFGTLVGKTVSNE